MPLVPLALVCLLLSWDAGAVMAQTYGADVNPTGSPIGGGPGYRNIVDEGTRVGTVAELVRALARARPGDVVFVDGRAVLDLTGQTPIRIPRGVTLASGRGRRGSPGALLYTDDPFAQPMILADGPDVRISGLRLRGPETRRLHVEMGRVLDRTGAIRGQTAARGIMTRHDRLEVDNCEMWGWSHAAVYAYGPPERPLRGVHVHHNYIHHNQRRGLGYGVAVRQADVLIEANRFDWNRHSIAGSGHRGTSYEARYNEVGPNANGHAFDMHGGRDRGDGTTTAGTSVYIHHNTFRTTDVQAVRIRGRPERSARIEHNWFLGNGSDGSPPAVEQRYGTGNVSVGRNAYGPSRRVEQGGLVVRR